MSLVRDPGLARLLAECDVLAARILRPDEPPRPLPARDLGVRVATWRDALRQADRALRQPAQGPGAA